MLKKVFYYKYEQNKYDRSYLQLESLCHFNVFCTYRILRYFTTNDNSLSKRCLNHALNRILTISLLL